MNEPMERVDVVHFVTGGFSGATSVAVKLVTEANCRGGRHLLVLRKKRQTQSAQLQALNVAGIPFRLVPGWSNIATTYNLVRLFKRLRPKVVIAHGFSEHLWGRLAAVITGVPVIIHVEHNSRERYTVWRLWLAKQLARRTRWIVGVSEGVRNSLIAYGFPVEKCVFVNNGIDLTPFKDPPDLAWKDRIPGIVMCARFARQKDHETLIKALAILKNQYQLKLPLTLVGGGKASMRRANERLAKDLDLETQIQFLGYQSDVPSLLKETSIAVLSTHYEGFGLVLAEALAAGCFAIGSAVPGVQEWLADIDEKFVVAAANPQALADRIAWVLSDPVRAAAIVERGRLTIRESFGLQHMLAQYEKLIEN